MRPNRKEGTAWLVSKDGEEKILAHMQAVSPLLGQA